MQNIRGCDAICSNQLALYMRFYIPRRPAHTACVYTPPLPTFYGINHTGFRRHGRLPKYEDRLWVRSKTQLLLALVFVLVVVPCTFKYAVPVFWQLYFSGVEVRVCGFVVDKKEWMRYAFARINSMEIHRIAGEWARTPLFPSISLLFTRPPSNPFVAMK